MGFRFYALKLSGIMVLVFLMQVFVSGFTEVFVLNDSSIYGMQVWRFLTAVFLHGGVGHLFLNLFALVLFGSILEKLISGRRFLIVFFASGILANLVSVNFYGSSLGASGAIFGVIGALVVVRPMLPVWAFGMPMPMIFAGLVWAVIDVVGTIGFLAGNPIDNTGNIAHLSGMFFGFVFGAVWRSSMSDRRREKVVIDEKKIREWERGWMGL